MKLTRIFALLLAATFALCIFTACGKEEEEAAPDKLLLPGKAVITFDHYEDGSYHSETNVYTLRQLEDGSISVFRESSVQDSYSSYNLELVVDVNGNLMRRVTYEEDGSVSTLHEYAYDDKGNRTVSVAFDKNGERLWRFATEYTYDESGKLTRETVRGMEMEVVSYTDYVYDDDGRLIRETEYGSSPSSVEYTYDAKGNLTKETHLRGEKVIYYYEYAYDENGNLTKESTFQEDGRCSSSATYGANGKQKKRTEYQSDGSKYEFEYDDKGNRTAYIGYEADGTLSFREDTSYRYNASGYVSQYSVSGTYGAVKRSFEVREYADFEPTQAQADYIMNAFGQDSDMLFG